jgi:hypothetical protein
MKATPTSDVDRTELDRFRLSLLPELEIEVDDRVIFLKSAEPPSWIQFFAEAPWWIQMFGLYGSLYVAKIVEEAAKDTWKNKSILFSSVVGSTTKIWRLAHSYFELKSRISPRTKMVIGLPIPDDHFGIRYELTGENVEEISAEIALFVQYVPAILLLTETEGLTKGRVVGPMKLELNDNASLQVSWTNRDNFNRVERVLRLENGE